MSKKNLYTVRSGASFMVLKFDEDLNHETTYFTSPEGCSCPAGHMDNCRHRDMLKLFKEVDRVDSGWFVNWDKGQWVDPIYGFKDLPEGAVQVDMNDPEAMHNTIKGAVGE